MRYLVIFTSLVLAVCLLCSFMPTKNDMKIYDDIVRLHIIAASDSEEDQRLKEGVRDAVLPLLADASNQAKNAKEAELFLSATLDAVRETAENYLLSNGCEYPVSVTVSREVYPERTFKNITLPAGEYTSLRIMIGEAVGRNWWGVLFPQLCTGAASAEKELKKTGFTSDQINILTEIESPKYKIKFKILEIFS